MLLPDGIRTDANTVRKGDVFASINQIGHGARDHLADNRPIAGRGTGAIVAVKQNQNFHVNGTEIRTDGDGGGIHLELQVKDIGAEGHVGVHIGRVVPIDLSYTGTGSFVGGCSKVGGRLILVQNGVVVVQNLDTINAAIVGNVFELVADRSHTIGVVERSGCQFTNGGVVFRFRIGQLLQLHGDIPDAAFIGDILDVTSRARVAIKVILPGCGNGATDSPGVDPLGVQGGIGTDTGSTDGGCGAAGVRVPARKDIASVLGGLVGIFRQVREFVLVFLVSNRGAALFVKGNFVQADGDYCS